VVWEDGEGDLASYPIRFQCKRKAQQAKRHPPRKLGQRIRTFTTGCRVIAVGANAEGCATRLDSTAV
jgi:hypothetical protein